MENVTQCLCTHQERKAWHMECLDDVLGFIALCPGGVLKY